MRLLTTWIISLAVLFSLSACKMDGDSLFGDNAVDNEEANIRRWYQQDICSQRKVTYDAGSSWEASSCSKFPNKEAPEAHVVEISELGSGKIKVVLDRFYDGSTMMFPVVKELQFETSGYSGGNKGEFECIRASNDVREKVQLKREYECAFDASVMGTYHFNKIILAREDCETEMIYHSDYLHPACEDVVAKNYYYGYGISKTWLGNTELITVTKTSATP